MSAMDPQKIILLTEMEIVHAFAPKSRDEQDRVDELVAEGLCASELRRLRGHGATVTVYRLTPAGMAFLQSRRREAGKAK